MIAAQTKVGGGQYSRRQLATSPRRSLLRGDLADCWEFSAQRGARLVTERQALGRQSIVDATVLMDARLR